MPVLSLVVSMAAASAAQSSATPADGWEVHQADRFCYVWLARPDSQGTEFALALDPSDKATIILTNPAWQIRPNISYRVTAGVDGAAKRMAAQGLRLGSDLVALVADVEEPGFVERFANASSLQFELRNAKKGPGQGSFDLAGAAAAVTALRQCQDRLRVRLADLAKLKADRETSLRTDPYAADEAQRTDPDR